MKLISIIVIPIFVFFVISYGNAKKINIYDSFLLGVKEGLKICYNIFPAILAMIFAVNLFLNSDVLSFLLAPITRIINIPKEILPMAILRPISGTASMSIMTNIFAIYGPDSYAGRLASILQGCTDTTVYVIALYFGSIKITKIKHALWGGLFADLVGIIMAIVLTNLFF